MREILQVLVQPQPQLGGPGDNGRPGVVLAQAQQGVEGHRRVVAFVPVLVEQAVVVGAPGDQPVLGGVDLGAEGRVFRRGNAIASGCEDRPIARAAAEVAGDVGLGLLDRRTIEVHGGQRHDKAGGAEPALRTVTSDHGILHGVQAVRRLSKVFNRHDPMSVNRRQQRDAGVDRSIDKVVFRAFDMGQQHGTGATIALVAAFLGSRAAAMLTQEIQQRGCR
ncbi:MAG: Uncharacterised protein [Rhodospirillaceae bacterium]|nr:MAG: Uncharacterised protein [Rhodospirillaceae bacterium]